MRQLGCFNFTEGKTFILVLGTDANSLSRSIKQSRSSLPIVELKIDEIFYITFNQEPICSFSRDKYFAIK